jgi:hypothetical protein
MREPTPAERATIEQLLSLSEDQLQILLGYTMAPPGVFYEREAAQEQGKTWLNKFVENNREAICEQYRAWNSQSRQRDDVLLVAALADILTTVLGGPGGVFNVATLLVLRGLDGLCEDPAVEAAEPSGDEDPPDTEDDEAASGR